MRISCSSQVNFGTCFGSAWVEKIFLFYIKTISWWHYFCFFNIGKKNVFEFVFILVFWQCFSNKMTYVCFCVGLIHLRKKCRFIHLVVYYTVKNVNWILKWFFTLSTWKLCLEIWKYFQKIQVISKLSIIAVQLI